MHQFLPETHDDLIALELSGKLDAADYKDILPVLEAAIERHGKIRLLWEMTDFEGWTLGGLWEDGQFDVRHSENFSKIAMVGEKHWQEWMTQAIKRFTPAEVRYFESGFRADALAWLE